MLHSTNCRKIRTSPDGKSGALLVVIITMGIYTIVGVSYIRESVKGNGIETGR